jgi:immune inhibitor A
VNLRGLTAFLIAAAIATPAFAVVQPPVDWLDSPQKHDLWRQMEPKLQNLEFGDQPPMTGTETESLSGIRGYFGQSDEEIALQLKSAAAADVYKYDLNMDGRVDQFDALELGYRVSPATKRTSIAPPTGTNKIVLLRQDMQGEDANYASYNQAYFNDRFFSDGTAAKPSFRDYFQEVSYGKLDVNGTIASSGPGGDGWFKAAHTRQWYKDLSWSGAPIFVREAVLAADAEIDYSQFDVDHDGYVDTLMVFYPNVEFAPPFWPHRSSGLNISVDGVIVDSYFISGYNTSADSWTMEISCHEYGHILGLPDLYDVNGGSNGMGVWSLMAYQYDGNHRIPSPDPWCKCKLGWTTAKNITEDQVGYSLADYQSGNNNNVLRIWTNGKHEDQYFLVANYRKTGTDANRPGAGLLVLHIDDSIGGNDQDNANEFRKHVDVESARGQDDPNSDTPEDPLDLQSDLGHANDLWFSGNGAAAYTGVFGDTSNPNSDMYPHPYQPTSVELSNISPAAASMTLDIKVKTPNAPTCVITAPTAGATITGNTQLDVTATPAGGRTITQVDFWCNEAFLGTDTTSPYSLTFDSRPIYNGARGIRAVATDNAGEIDTDIISVTASNSAVSLPFSETFESGIGAWASYNSGDRWWQSKSQFHAGAKSAGIGSTTIGYDYDEHDELVSIKFNLTGTTHPVARWFERYRVAAGENTVKVFVTEDNGASFDLLSSKTGSNLPWHPANVDLASYVGQQVNLVFRLDGSTLNRSGGDAGWWIDSLQVQERSAPPQINSITPADGSTVSGNTPITVNASDDEAVTQVDFSIDGSDKIFTDYTSPFTYTWNSDWVFNGSHGFTAKAWDLDGQSATTTVNWTASNNGTNLPFSEPFASDPGIAWRVKDPAGAGWWHYGAAFGYNPSGGMYMGINTEYDDNENDWYISPTVSIGSTPQPYLWYLQRYDIEANYDYARVFVTTNLSSWSELANFSLENKPWEARQYSIGGYANQKVKIGFFFESDGGVVEQGWNLDNVEVRSAPQITTLSPSRILIGQTPEITINGNSFGATTELFTHIVTVCGVNATIVSWTPTQIKVNCPAGLASGNVVVTRGGVDGNSKYLAFILGAPNLGGVGQL